DWDPDGNLDPASVTLVDGGSADANGTLTLNADGSFTYTPDLDFVGQVSFTYQVCDTGTPVYCDEAIVTIDIYPNPFGENYTFAVDDSYIGTQDDPIIGNILANDYDPELDIQTFSAILVEPQHGTVTVTLAGDFVYTPEPGYYGPDQFVYEVCDDGTPIACDQATVYLLVAPLPDVTPIITAVPNVMNGPTDFYVTVRITELNNVNTNGLITVRIPKDTRWVLDGPYDQSLTMLGTTPLNNADWNYSDDATYHIFTTTAVIPAGGFSYFGFNARWDAGQTVGIYTITSQIVEGSGGEIRIDNNVDAEKLDYFIN
ncbi:MAG: cadherin-like domain-containing protein, partial [Bacteroidales bacterium]|nr:cadherin-like domain-containing protein [Bacteroidales bacterium]